MRAPFPWAGYKGAIAPLVRRRLGGCHVYCEPFAGGLGVALASPEPLGTIEVFGDLDGLLLNFWRAVREAPDAVVEAAERPASNLDALACQITLKARESELTARLGGDPDAYDAELAGLWCSVMGLWTSAKRPPTVRGPWIAIDGRARRVPGADGVTMRPASVSPLRYTLAMHARAIAARLQRAVLVCGDWRRTLSVARSSAGRRTLAVFLAPPYPDADPALYSGSASVDGLLEECSALERLGARVGLCCMGDIPRPRGWYKETWRRQRGIGDRNTEVIYWSPAVGAGQASLFGDDAQQDAAG